MYTVDSRYYDICYNEILLIMKSNPYPNHSQTIEIQTVYIDSLVILIHFPYPISNVIMGLLYKHAPLPFTVDSRYYDICYNEILLIMIPNLYTNHSQTIEI
jgi:hypothetical protein